MLLVSPVAHAQTFSTEKLIEDLKATDLYQTRKFSDLCNDLLVNFNEKAFNARSREIQQYLRWHPDTRIKVRLFMYERFAWLKMNKQDTLNTKANYFNIIKQASGLNDEQLLSELYTRYALLCTRSESLYYLLKCIQIREHIGLHYFTDVSANYHWLSTILYDIADYENSAAYASRGLAFYNENDKQSILFLYILTADMAGASFLKTNKPDSALYYYRHIGYLIDDCIRYPERYKSPDMTPQRLQIWNGVVKGGIAKALMLQKKYDEAYPLLEQNLESSTRYQQWADMAAVQNALAKIDASRKQLRLATSRYRQAYQLAVKDSVVALLIASSEGLSAAFAAQQRYDSAYIYHQHYLQWKNQLDERVNNARLNVAKSQIDFEKMQKELVQSQNNTVEQKRIRNLILMAIVFLTIIAILLYNRKRLHMRLQYEKLEKEKQQSAAAMIYAQQQIDFVLEKVAEKNQLIKQLQYQVMEVGSPEISTELDNMTILTEKDWQKFKVSFEILHPGFLDRLREKMPSITPAEQRIVTLAKLGFGTKEMAAATGVSSETIRSVSSRLRKKFNISATLQALANEI